MLQQSDIDLRGCRVHLRRGGSGEPLLFLHGAQGLTGEEAGLKALAEGFEVIAPDHPGFGRSDQAERVDDIADLALFYFDLLDHLRLDRVHLVGQCIGGWLAAEMAIRSTARIRSLVLVNSAGLRLRGVPRGDMFLCSEEDLLRLLFAGEAAGDWMSAWRATPEMEDLYDRNRAAAARYSWAPRLCNPKLDRWLHRIDVPTRIIWGTNDRVIPPAYASAFGERIAGATVAMLPDCAHLPHVEQPQAFAREVTEFIRRAAR